MTGMSLVTIAEDDYRELIEKANAACEERDKLSAELDWVAMEYLTAEDREYLIESDSPCPEHLRKKLEGKT